MKTKFFLVLALSVLLLLSGCSKNAEIDSSIDMAPNLISLSSEMTAGEVAPKVTPAVVGILARGTYTESVGSGVAVSSDGHIITNEHVISGAKSIVVYLANKEVANAALIWSDAAMDIAILKCERSLPFLEMSSSSNLTQGEQVIAVGTPISLQFKHSVTAGVVSALNRTIESDYGGISGYLQNLIQHDASINPGNSGGPLINLKGQIVGINTLKVVDAEGMGFAIPIETCAAILDKLKVDVTYSAPKLGLYGFDAEIAAFNGKTDIDSGVYVLNVDSGMAKDSGLKKGDVIVKWGPDKISSMLELRLALYKTNTNEPFEVEVYRDGKPIIISVKAASQKQNAV